MQRFSPKPWVNKQDEVPREIKKAIDLAHARRRYYGRKKREQVKQLDEFLAKHKGM